MIDCISGEGSSSKAYPETSEESAVKNQPI